MDALQPQARPSGPIAELLAGMADQLHGGGRYPARSVPRIGRHQSIDASGPPPLPPPPNRPGTDSIVPPSGSWPVRPRILENDQAMSHPRPILRPSFHVAELDHWPPLVWTPSSDCPSKQRRSILSRYFRRGQNSLDLASKASDPCSRAGGQAKRPVGSAEAKGLLDRLSPRRSVEGSRVHVARKRHLDRRTADEMCYGTRTANEGG
jgi:hypothetical protein